jgi:5'-nucleotidase
MTDDEERDRTDGELPEMTRERARTERRDLDKERGEPLAGFAERLADRKGARGGSTGAPRGLRHAARPLAEWTTRPRILVTNDDGIESRGLLALKQALESIGEVTVVAPETNQSAVGHQKTLMRPLRVRERILADGSGGFSVDGSPTDAVSLAFLGYFRHGFDLVASGINYGANLGDDITYSGTVSAAMEAVINGCPAFAISQEYYEHPDFSLATSAAEIVARNILEHGLSRGELVNVNVPAATIEECEGIEVTRLGRRIYQDELVRRIDPRGIPYYWIGGPPPSGLAVPGTDFHAVVNRRIAVTPIHLDLTGRRLLRRLRTWDWELEPEAAPPAAVSPEVAAGHSGAATPATSRPSDEAAGEVGPETGATGTVEDRLSEEPRRERR